MGINTFPLGISVSLAIGARDIDQIEVRLNARNQFRSKSIPGVPDHFWRLYRCLNVSWSSGRMLDDPQKPQARQK